MTVPYEAFPLVFLAGVLLWTFLEYMLHRFLFHMEPPPNNKVLIGLHFVLHGQHHKVNAPETAESMSYFNPNHPKSFKILYMLLYDFGGFRLVECSYHVFTWGLMSQFCLSTKNVPFGYCTV